MSTSGIVSQALGFSSLLSTTATKEWLPIPCRSRLCAFQGYTTSLTKTTWNKYFVSYLAPTFTAILVLNALTSSCATIGTQTSHFTWFSCTFPKICHQLNTSSTSQSVFSPTKKSKSSTTILGFGRYARTASKNYKQLRDHAL